MPSVLGYHDVKDGKHWLASRKIEEIGPSLGVSNVRRFVDPQNPNRVGVVMDVADLDVLMASMQTPETAAAMEYDGVLPDTLVLLVEA